MRLAFLKHHRLWAAVAGAGLTALTASPARTQVLPDNVSGAQSVKWAAYSPACNSPVLPGCGMPGCQPAPLGLPSMTPPAQPPAQPAQPSPSQPSQRPESTTQPETNAQAPQANETAESFGAQAGESLAFSTGGVAGAGAAAGAAAAAPAAPGGIPAVITVVRTTTGPLILPGLFTAMQSELALPVDRVYFDYGYFSGFATAPGTERVTTTITNNAVPVGPSAVRTNVIPPAESFNLNRYNVGLEKAFFDHRASVFVRIPVLDATDNTSGQAIDGLGDVSAGFKVALLHDPESGSTLTGGLTVSAPTARDTVISTTTTAFQARLTVPPTPILSTSTTTTSTVNPTYIQPWAGGLLVMDRAFVHEYFGVIVPTDERVAKFINNDLTAGYQVYKGNGEGTLSFVAPLVSAQTLVPVGSNELNIPNQVFVSGGLAVGLGKAVVSGTVVTPVVGPKAYDIGGTVSLNFFF